MLNARIVGRAARVSFAAFATIVLVGSEGLAQDTEEDPGKAFDSAYARFSAAYRAGDPQAVAALYAEDAFYLAPGREITRGDVVRHFEFLSSFEPDSGPVIEFEIVDRDVAGDLAYDIGYYTMRRSAGDSAAGRGKFIVVWKRGEDGVWRIHADGYNAAGGQEAAEGGKR